MARTRSTPTYLKRRRLGWYVQLAVPVALQAMVGAKVLTRSLSTRDESEARRRSHAVIAELQQRIAAAASAPAQSDVDSLLSTAETLRAAQLAGIATAADSEAAMSVELDRLLDSQARRLGRDSEGHPRMPADEAAAVRRAVDVLAGRPDTSLSHLLSLHLQELESDGVLRASTLREKQRRITDFVNWFGGNHNWRDVRRGVAVDYLADLKQRRTGKHGKGPKLSRSSLVKWLSDLRVFFRWILDREDVDTRPANPFDGLQPAKVVRGRERAHRPWRPDELSTFLRGVPSDDPLWTLGAMCAYSGARLEELASLRTDAVDGKSFLVREGKRQASVRRVPIHPVLAPLVSRLVKTSPDGYLIPGLLSGGYDDKRGVLIGKRFGYALRRLGVDDPRVVLHSLRNTVETQLLSKGVPLERAQLIVGHERLGSSTPYVDRGSVQDRENHKAIALVSYGKALDRFVAETGAKVNVTPSARPRRRV